MLTIWRPGELAALSTALCFSIGVLAFTPAARQVGSLTVNWIRLIIAWVFLAGYGLLTRGSALPTDATEHAWFWLLISGFVGLFLGDLCLFKALVLIGPRLSMILMSLAPPLAAFLGIIFLDERLGILNWLGILVTILGTSWVVVERQADPNGPSRKPNLPGIALGVLASVGQAAGLVISKYGMGSYDPFAANQIRVTAAFGAFTVLLLFLNRYQGVASAFRRPRVMGLITLGAFMGPFLGVALLLVSLNYITTGKAQTLASTMPVMIIPLVIIFYREHVSLRAIAGAIVAVGGVALLFLGR